MVPEEARSLMGVQRSEDEWKIIVEEYRRSGMSLRAYAEEKGIQLKTLSNHTRSNVSLKSKVLPATKNRRRNLDEWAALIRDQILSGLSVNDWCKEKGISQAAMRDAERKIRTAENQKPQSWVQAHVTEGNSHKQLNEGRVLIRFPGVEIETEESYPAENIVFMIERLRQA